MSRLTLLFFLAGTALAQTTLVSETFNNGIPSHFTVQAGSAVVTNGALRLSSGCLQLAPPSGDPVFSRTQGLVVEADITLLEYGDFNVFGLYEGLPNCHTGPQNGYYTGWYALNSDNPDDQIDLVINGTSGRLATAAAQVIVGTKYRIRQEFLADGTIHTFVNGIRTMTVQNNSRTAGRLTLRTFGAVDIDNVLVSTGTDSFFESFQTLSRWTTRDSCVAASNPGPTFFCPGRVTTPPGSGTVKLTGQVLAGGRREGAEIDGPVQPATGTFAARVKFEGPNDGILGQASIKGFFTYAALGPCQHMEHDFEVLTGRSALYPLQNWINGDGWLVASQYRNWPILTPILSTVTHYCPGNQTLSTPTRYSVRGADDASGYLTLLVTVQCVRNCGSADPSYQADYWVGGNPSNARLVKTTVTVHSGGIGTLTPIFNLWWLDPHLPVFSDSSEQSMTVKWFSWDRAVLPFDAAHARGEACDALPSAGTDCQ